MSKLIDKYTNLLTEVLETEIRVVDGSIQTKIFYSDILNPSTMVFFKSRQWFYSKPYGVGMLHGVWTNSNGEEKSVYGFLNDIIDFDRPVEVVFDPRHFIPKDNDLVNKPVRKLSSGACVRVEKLNKSFFLILGELTYYWLDNKGNYYSEDTFSELCHTHKYEIIDPGHRVFN